jgi:hypothetical protein
VHRPLVGGGHGDGRIVHRAKLPPDRVRVLGAEHRGDRGTGVGRSQPAARRIARRRHAVGQRQLAARHPEPSRELA